MPQMHWQHIGKEGFTLIELSIVLVIIGLIVGAIFVGQDLVEAAAIRGQVSQIAKYDAAVNTFHLKYGGLPGDLTPQQASAFGFFARSGAFGDGDGNGYINSIEPPVAPPSLGGETVFFWTDLSAANLIDGSFKQSADALVNAASPSAIASYLPAAKIGHGDVIIVYGYGELLASGWYAARNEYQIINPTSITNGSVQSGTPLTPIEAFSLDTKIDDGMPLTGGVKLMVPNAAMAINTELNALWISFGAPWTNCIQVGPPVLYQTLDPTLRDTLFCSIRIQASF
jgi:prepilin-type N-terminal cleavage/methylation domain-containing protein